MNRGVINSAVMCLGLSLEQSTQTKIAYDPPGVVKNISATFGKDLTNAEPLESTEDDKQRPPHFALFINLRMYCVSHAVVDYCFAYSVRYAL